MSHRWFGLGWPLIAGLLALTSLAHAQTAVNVAIDATANGTPLERVWPFYGYDEINYTTSDEGRALLRALASANTAPVHVRNHFLFNTGDGSAGLKWGSTNVYTEDAAGNAVYSWLLTDGIMDAITQAGALPFVELGFMPEALSIHPNPYMNSSSSMLDGGCFYPPTDYTKWSGLIRTWARHANERYPSVERWLWELWNEPDIGYWNGSFDDYAKLYDYTESALHDVIPDALLGGPAVAGAGSTFLRRFLEHCATGTNAVTGEVGTRLDLVSFHAKGGVAINGDHVEMDLGSQLRLHRAGFNAVAGFSQFKQTPIYITEADPDGCAACPLSTIPANAYRNSTAYGAYELAMMKHTIELEDLVGIKLGGLLTWAFAFPGTGYFAGYRSLTSNGIDLPVLSAFKLLGRLDGMRLPLSSTGQRSLADVLASGVHGAPEIDGIATLNGTAVQVLIWNYHDELVTVPATPLHLEVRVPESFGPAARVSHLRVDEAHGDAYSVWLAQGMPANPSAAQIAALRDAMVPSPLVPDSNTPVGANGEVKLDFELPRFGVSLLTILPASELGSGDAGTDERPAGPGMDGASSCACRVGAWGEPAAGSMAFLAVGALALALAVRRRQTLQ